MKKTILSFSFLLMMVHVWAVPAYPDRYRMQSPLVEPMLLSPCTDGFVWEGTDPVIFRWLPYKRANIQYYQFRLYRGYQTTVDNLLVSERTRNAAPSLSVPADQFNKGKTYSWTLYGVNFDGRRTVAGSCAFTIQ